MTTKRHHHRSRSFRTLIVVLVVILSYLAPAQSAAAAPAREPRPAPAVASPHLQESGYEVADSGDAGGPLYAYEDIAASGAPLQSSGDAMSQALPLGFTFDFYGQDYDSLYVCANGFVTFLPNQSCEPDGTGLPAAPDPNGLIAAWWTDLDPQSEGTIQTTTLGTSPYRRFILQFTDVPYAGARNKRVTFQLKLFETTNFIEVHYLDTSTATGAIGATYTAGIENQDGTVGLPYDYKTPLKNIAVRYWRPGSPGMCRARVAPDASPGGTATVYTTLQAAVDAASTGDTVQITGFCGGVSGQGNEFQAATLNTSLALRGGYSADFTAWNPISYPTTIDALGQGRVIRLAYGTSATITSLTLSGGNAVPLQTSAGGGIKADGNTTLTLRDCRVIGNAAAQGAGIDVERGGTAHLTNTIIAGNRVTTGGAAISGQAAAMTLVHVTLADNAGGSAGVSLLNGSSAVFTNTIVSGHTLGLATNDTSTAQLTATLWHNTQDFTGAVTHTHDVYGDPAFVDATAGDYRIHTVSPAFDAGVLTGVDSDFEGDARSTLALFPDPPDLGADENPVTVVPRPIAGELTFGAGQATMAFTDTATLQAITVTLDLAYPTAQTSHLPLRRTYTIHADTGAPFSGTMTLTYTDDEVAESGSIESGLLAYREVDGNWIPYPTVVNTLTNAVLIPQVTGFSRWALGDAGHAPEKPTAVTLVTVQAGGSLTLQLGGLLLLVGAVPATVLRRRRPVA